MLVPALSLAYHLVSLLLFDLETHSPLVALLPSLLVHILYEGKPVSCTVHLYCTYCTLVLYILYTCTLYILSEGVIQPLICSLVALIICPLLAGCIAAAAITRKGI